MTETGVSWTGAMVAVLFSDEAIANVVYGFGGAVSVLTAICVGVEDDVVFTAVTAGTTYICKSSTGRTTAL